jgi:hypothetical protein
MYSQLVSAWESLHHTLLDDQSGDGEPFIRYQQSNGITECAVAEQILVHSGLEIVNEDQRRSMIRHFT